VKKIGAWNQEVGHPWFRVSGQVLGFAGPALAGAGPNAGPRRWAPLSSGFMTSSCLVNRAKRQDRN